MTQYIPDRDKIYTPDQLKYQRRVVTKEKRLHANPEVNRYRTRQERRRREFNEQITILGFIAVVLLVLSLLNRFM